MFPSRRRRAAERRRDAARAQHALRNAHLARCRGELQRQRPARRCSRLRPPSTRRRRTDRQGRSRRRRRRPRADPARCRPSRSRRAHAPSDDVVRDARAPPHARRPASTRRSVASSTVPPAPGRSLEAAGRGRQQIAELEFLHDERASPAPTTSPAGAPATRRRRAAPRCASCRAPASRPTAAALAETLAVGRHRQAHGRMPPEGSAVADDASTRSSAGAASSPSISSSRLAARECGVDPRMRARIPPEIRVRRDLRCRSHRRTRRRPAVEGVELERRARRARRDRRCRRAPRTRRPRACSASHSSAGPTAPRYAATGSVGNRRVVDRRHPQRPAPAARGGSAKRARRPSRSGRNANRSTTRSAAALDDRRDAQRHSPQFGRRARPHAEARASRTGSRLPVSVVSWRSIAAFAVSPLTRSERGQRARPGARRRAGRRPTGGRAGAALDFRRRARGDRASRIITGARGAAAGRRTIVAPPMTSAQPAIIGSVIVSPRNSAPHSMPNTGIRNAIVSARVGPMSAISR